MFLIDIVITCFVNLGEKN